jgi:Protein of unknown function (DUF3987)
VSDWITEFLALTDGTRSPFSFRLWTAIGTIAAVLERRVWTVTDAPDPLRPNLYTVLAGGPASGKTIMVSIARKLLVSLVKPDGVFLGPDNPTKASFMHALEASGKVSINGMGVPYYSAMTVLCRELGVLISKFEKDFVADLTDIYDNPDNYSSPRTSVKGTNVPAPTINILACATPAALDDIIPDNAWDQGFTSRVIFIYGAAPGVYRDMFSRYRDTDAEALKTQLKTFFHELHGEFEWEPEAQDAIRHWFNEEKMAPVPTYSRLVNYQGRRNEHLMKLSMISAVSAENGLCVTLSDFRRAQKWLFDAEEAMPDVFRAMRQKSDAQLLQDCWYWMHGRYYKISRDKRVAIPEKEVWSWFEDKTTHDKIQGLMTAMQKTGRMKPGNFAGDWVPANLDPRMPQETGDTNPEIAPREGEAP